MPDPAMDAQAWAQLQPLVDRALDLDEPARSAFVDQLARTDPAAGRQLADFLQQADAASEPVERALAQRPALVMAALAEADERLRLPMRIGPYLVRGTIGRGGMGTVLLAERADGEFEQQVALKLVKKGMDSAEILERFRTERQIVARLQHPHIARLLDGGATADGQPWFAMEHVAGQALTAFCDEQRLTIEARVRLFLQVCDAVDYAHRNLVVHRDLKPSNVLVTADGLAKLLDFGIAKVLDPEGGDATLTRRESRALTPAYAAPEQLLGEPVTTATDVYSLGVTLYELLSGHRPFAPPGASRTAVEHAVLQLEPDPPSRAATSDDRPAHEQLAAARGTTPDRLAHRLRDDLDTIVLTAIRKTPERRYPSARALADDLRRNLEGLPVEARPDTLAYRASRFVRRHRVGVAATGLVVLSIVGGVAATVRQTRQALRAAQRADEVKRFVLSLFALSDPNASRGKDLSPRTLLDGGVRRVESELASQPEIQAEMLLVIGNLKQQLGLESESRPLLEQALALRRRLEGDDGLGVAEVELALGQLNFSEGKMDKADELLASALRKRERRLGADHADTAYARGVLGRTRLDRGYLPEARALLEQAVADQRTRLPVPHVELATNINGLARVVHAQADYARAESLYREALAQRRQLFGNEHTRVSETLANLASLRSEQGDLRGAAADYREILEIDRPLLGSSHERISTHLNNLGTILLGMGDCAGAEQAFAEALAIRRARYGVGSAPTALCLHNLARALRCGGKLPEAEAAAREGLALAVGMLGDDHPNVGAVREALAATLRERGKLLEAEALARRALAAYRNKLPADHPWIADGTLTLGRVLVSAGRAAETESSIREALVSRQHRFGDSDWRTAQARVVLAECLLALARTAEADRELAAARPVLAEALGATHPLVRSADALTSRD